MTRYHAIPKTLERCDEQHLRAARPGPSATSSGGEAALCNAILRLPRPEVTIFQVSRKRLFVSILIIVQ